MSHPLEFIMKLRDMVSQPLKVMQSSGMHAYKSLENAASSLKNKNDQIPHSISQIKDRLNELQKAREISISRRQIDAADREIQQLERRLNGLDKKGSGGFFSGGMGGMIGQGLAVAGIGGMMALGTGIANFGMEAEKQNASFKVMLGSAEKGQEMISNIRQMAAETPFGTNELIKSSQTLLQFGINADKVLPTMKMLGDVAGGDAQRVQGLTLAFAQMSSTGKLQGQDLMQMVNAGFNPLLEIADKTGISIGDLKEKMSQGAISAKMVEMALQSVTASGGQFYNLMKEQSETTGGRFAALVDNVQMTGLSMYESMKPLLNILLNVGNFLLENTELVVTAAGAYATYSVITNASAIATQTMAAKQWLLNIAMSANPIGLVVAGIVALGGIVYWAYNKLDWFRGGVKGAWEGLKALGGIIKDYVIDRFKGMLTGIQGIGNAISLFLDGKFSDSWKAAKQGASDLMGVTAAKNAYDNAYKVGEATKNGYDKGVAEIAAKTPKIKNQKSSGIAPSAEDFQAAMLAGESSKKGKKSSAITGLSDSADGISGGAGRNITINLGKFFDNIIINSQTFTEGIENVEHYVEESMMRVINSTNAGG